VTKAHPGVSGVIDNAGTREVSDIALCLEKAFQKLLTASDHVRAQGVSIGCPTWQYSIKGDT
jgi:hypothetical protein